MADVIFSEVLCFLNKNIKRFDKSTLLEVISKFYHEDELYDAKTELCKVVAALQPDESPPDGWAKFVNTKGIPVMRRSNDGAQRRRAEADDLINMLFILDVNKVNLPKFVIEDPDRVPSGTWTVTTSDSSVLASTLMTTVQDVLMKFTETMNGIVQRLDNLEMKLSCRISDSGTSAPLQSGQAHNAPSAPVLQVLNNTDDSSDTASGTDPHVASTSWADQARGLVEAGPRLSFNTNNRRPAVRVRGQAASSSVKGVPRQLTCFVSRLDLSVTEEELTGFLQSQGILDASCRKLSPKDGRVFRTSAFRVSCSSRFESLFYDETKWPEGAELRDWVFYSNNGRR